MVSYLGFVLSVFLNTILICIYIIFVGKSDYKQDSSSLCYFFDLVYQVECGNFNTFLVHGLIWGFLLMG